MEIDGRVRIGMTGGDSKSANPHQAFLEADERKSDERKADERTSGRADGGRADGASERGPPGARRPDEQRQSMPDRGRHTWQTPEMTELFGTIADLESIEEVERFLRDLCTLAELEAMAHRWEVVRLLEQLLLLCCPVQSSMCEMRHLCSARFPKVRQNFGPSR